MEVAEQVKQRIKGVIDSKEGLRLYKQKLEKGVKQYTKIMELYKNGNLEQSFKKEYIRFYRLSLLTRSFSKDNYNQFLERYFQLLKEGNTDLEYILKELHKIPNKKGIHTLQFSFATKLIHTIKPENPLNDQNVGVIIGKCYGKDKLKVYEHLKEVYTALLRNKEFMDILKNVRKEFEKLGEDLSMINDVKLIDFLVWQLEKVEKL